jgi:hypothetical protein
MIWHYLAYILTVFASAVAAAALSAYALRQINEDLEDLYGVAGHITSLNTLRPSRMQYPILGIGSRNHRQR